MRAAVAAAGMGAAMAGCSSHDGPGPNEARGYIKGLNGSEKGLRPGSDANTAYADAMALKAHGDCAGAVPKLRQVAALGPGYEGAQTALGECVIQPTKTDMTSDYAEGLMWLLRAADSGWPEAQAQLAYAYALGPTAIRNANEAAYWLALYRGNTGKSRVGFVPMPADQLSAVVKSLPPETLAAGQARADKWERKVWFPPTPPHTTDKPDEERPRMRHHRGRGDGDE
jgi:hypothetical protein